MIIGIAIMSGLVHIIIHFIASFSDTSFFIICLSFSDYLSLLGLLLASDLSDLIRAVNLLL